MAISESILMIDMDIYRRGRVVTIIVLYGPNEDEMMKKKDTFWEKLNEIVKGSNGSVIILRDVNGRVGKTWEVTSKEIGTCGDEARRNNGTRLIGFYRK